MTQITMQEKKLYKNFLDISSRLGKSFVNRTPLLTVGPKAFTIIGAVAAAAQSNTNMYLIGSRGTAKTVLAETLQRSVFNNEGFYLRGDINLQLKDLFMDLNLDGKTEEQIFVVSKATGFKFALIDELNRLPGVLQNQFLNIADGYIEIRGKKYPLGTGDYMLMVATGNPPDNGGHPGVFDEDLALLDRIVLLINVDELELAKGDVFKISEMDIDKNSIQIADLSHDVLSSFQFLRSLMNKDSEVVAARSLIMEHLSRTFRYVDINGRTIDKAVEKGWRDALSGEHQGGLVVSYCSDISVRILKHAARLAFTLHKIAEIEGKLLVQRGLVDSSVGLQEYIDAYLESLKMALNYDRRFIPEGLPEQLDMTHRDMIKRAFSDVSSTIDADDFGNAVILLLEFNAELEKGNEENARKIMKVASDAMDEDQMMRAAHDVMESKIREKEENERTQMLYSMLEEVA